MLKVVVYNTDGVNAYAAELAGLLHERGVAVTVVDAVNGDHCPPSGVRWRRMLPANFGTESGVTQLLRLARGLAATLWDGSGRRHVIVVAYSRFPLEDFAFAAIAALGRPVVVVTHNPVPRGAESFLGRRARRALLRKAMTVVVHAERLLDDVDPAAGDRVVVCPHPPYLHTGRAASHQETLAEGRRWLAFIGTLRQDKGVHLLPELLARVPESERLRLGLIVCGRGELSESARDDLRDLGVAVHDLTSPAPVSQATLLGVLARRPLVLAPYVAATQSGTIILALSVGCRVVAFDKGGIRDVLSPAGLVPIGDLDEFARAVAEDRGGASVLPLDEWARRAGEAWWRTVTGATRRK